MLVPACGRRCAREGDSSEAEPARGRRGPSIEAEPARGRVSPRARRASLEGGVSSRARRTLLEGAPCWPALVGRGGHHGVGCAVCVCFVLCSRRVCVLCFLQVLSKIPPVFLGDPHGCPRQRVLGSKANSRRANPLTPPKNHILALFHLPALCGHPRRCAGAVRESQYQLHDTMPPTTVPPPHRTH
jgi:hypothetical protein